MSELAQRRDYLEGALAVARGRLALLQAQVVEEEAGVYQIEGRLLEVTEQLQAEVKDGEVPSDPPVLD